MSSAGGTTVCANHHPGPYVFPAEFGRHDAVFMAWPTYENKKGRPTQEVQAQMIAAFRGHVRVELLVQDRADEDSARAYLGIRGVSLSHVRFRAIPHLDVWIRDNGPIFTQSVDGRSLRVVDFGFNTWGYETPTSKGSRRDGAIDRLVARELELPLLWTSVISEGGNREFNGSGTMMVTESVELRRNPGMDREQLAAEYRRTLGVKNILWLKRGVMEDDLTIDGPLPGNYYTVLTTGGHIDEYARFVSQKKILLAEVTKREIASERNPYFRAILMENRRRMEENLAVLRESHDVDGRPFEIVRFPMPALMEDTLRAGDGVFDYFLKLSFTKGLRISPDQTVKVLLAASYLNFFITNGLVLMQEYFRPGLSEDLRQRDARARALLGRAFPDREVVGIHAEAVNLGGGGIHCITQQQPALRP